MAQSFQLTTRIFVGDELFFCADFTGIKGMFVGEYEGK